MPYIGNTSPSRFVSNRAASVYSGDGSTTAFTLEQAVVQDEDILVSVDGVVQEPSVAYAVSNGTTLTFTGAPSSNAGNNIFVYYLASQVGTVGHPAAQNLSAGTGTFTGDVTIGDASAADKKILFDGNAQDYHIGLDDSADSLIIGKGSALGTTTSMAFNADGIITKPLQPAFLALPSSTIVNLSTGANANLAFATERFDQNSDYNNSNYTFTAPVTGKYPANIVMYINQLDSAVAYYEFSIVSSNKTYYTIFDPDFSQDNAYFTLTFAALIDMDAADTATIGLHQQGGSSQTDVSAQSNWSMYLVC
jgi:hypothetical protein